MRALVVIGLLGLAACGSVASSPPAPPPLETIERTVGTGPGPVVVMLHGYGSAPEHLVGLADRTDLPGGTILVLPRAPSPIPGRSEGTMWWELPRDLSRLGEGRQPGMDEARARVIGLLDAVEAQHPGRRLILGGFSQGAMTSLDVALHDPRPLAGLALLSGTMIDETETIARLDTRRGLRVYASHGVSDDVLAFDADARLMDVMRLHGLDVRFTTFFGGHVVTDEVSTELAAFVARCASGS